MEKTVIVTIEGGMVQHVEVPKGVRVIVRDYDTEGADADLVQKDENGDECFESIWSGDLDG
jgi:hypothetical protein